MERIAKGVGKPPREVAKLRQVFSFLPHFTFRLELGEPCRHPVERALQVPDLTGRGHRNLNPKISVAQRLRTFRKRPQRSSQPARHHRGCEEAEDQQETAHRRPFAHGFLDLFDRGRHRDRDPVDRLIVFTHHQKSIVALFAILDRDHQLSDVSRHRGNGRHGVFVFAKHQAVAIVNLTGFDDPLDLLGP